jgi:hypothetical protein
MPRTRAERRHHRERMKARAAHFFDIQWEKNKHPDVYQHRLVRRIDTPARCSCWMCGNPRRYSCGAERKTIQERKADQIMKDELNEF